MDSEIKYVSFATSESLTLWSRLCQAELFTWMTEEVLDADESGFEIYFMRKRLAQTLIHSFLTSFGFKKYVTNTFSVISSISITGRQLMFGFWSNYLLVCTQKMEEFEEMPDTCGFLKCFWTGQRSTAFYWTCYQAQMALNPKWKGDGLQLWGEKSHPEWLCLFLLLVGAVWKQN